MFRRGNLWNKISISALEKILLKVEVFCQLSDEMVKKLEDLKFVDEIENEILGRMNM